MDDLLKLAEHYEVRAMFYAPRMFNENGVATGHARDPESHREEVAYTANLLTIAAALRAHSSVTVRGE